VDVVGTEGAVQLARDGLRLRDLLRLEPVALQHVLEVHVAADVQLVRTVEHEAAVLEQACEDAMHDGRAELALDVVADDGDAGVGEALRPDGVAGDEHGDGVDESHAGLQCCGGVVLLRFLRSHREVGDENFGSACAQHLGDVDRSGGRLFDDLAVVAAETVESWPALDVDAEGRHVGETDRVVLTRPDRLRQVEPDLLGVDVEGGHDLGVPDVITAEDHVHETRDGVGRVSRAVVLDALQQRAGAVADACDGDLDRLVGHSWFL
jgi:hypothetical protein